MGRGQRKLAAPMFLLCSTQTSPPWHNPRPTVSGNLPVSLRIAPRFRRCLLSLLLLAACHGAHAEERFPAPLPVWLDLDAGALFAGERSNGVLAIEAASRLPGLRVLGVSAVYGTLPVGEAALLLSEPLTRLFPEGPPLVTGAAGPQDGEGAARAAAAMAEALAREPFHLLALGPTTNVAALLTRHRQLQPHILSIVISAGQRPLRTLQPNPERDVHFADFNVAMDPEAARLVLEARPELRHFPWEAVALVAFHAGDSALAGWRVPWREATGREALIPWDALAVLWLAQPAWFDAAEVSVALQRAPHDGAASAGPLTMDGRREYLTVDFKSESGRYARYATRTKQEAAAWLAALLRDNGWEHDDREKR